MAIKQTFDTPDNYGRFGVRSLNDATKVVTRRVMAPGIVDNGVWIDTDISTESAELKAVAAQAWTVGAKTALETLLRAQAAAIVPPLTDQQIANAALMEEGSVVRALGEIVFGMIKGTIPVTPAITAAQFRALVLQHMRTSP